MKGNYKNFVLTFEDLAENSSKEREEFEKKLQGINSVQNTSARSYEILKQAVINASVTLNQKKVYDKKFVQQPYVPV